MVKWAIVCIYVHVCVCELLYALICVSAHYCSSTSPLSAKACCAFILYRYFFALFAFWVKFEISRISQTVTSSQKYHRKGKNQIKLNKRMMDCCECWVSAHKGHRRERKKNKMKKNFEKYLRNNFQIKGSKTSAFSAGHNQLGSHI